jgi:hypothetical protein
MRQKRIVERVLAPRAFPDIATFYQHQRTLVEYVALSIQNEIDQFLYGLEILVAGLSADRAHIYAVLDPGTSQCWDFVNFHAIGFGGTHAISALIGREAHQGMSYLDGTMAVLDAKRIAERAPGVGPSTDIAIIRRDGNIAVSQDNIAKIIEINDIWRRREVSWEQKLREFFENKSDDLKADKSMSKVVMAGKEQENDEKGTAP